MKTVLFVNDTQALWVGFERDACVNLHVESMCVDANRDEQVTYRPCAWLESTPEPVHLVIESDQTEISAYPLQPSGTLLRQFSHKKALRKTLIDRFPGAIIHSPMKSTGINAMLVQQPGLSDVCRQWLEYVEQSSLTVCSVTTSAEAVATLFAQSDQSYLVISSTPGYCKHTFCRSGHALFTRTLAQTDELPIIRAIEETLSHLHTVELIDAPVQTFVLGVSQRQLGGVDELEWVAGLEQYDEQIPADIASKTQSGDDVRYSAVVQIARQALKQSVQRSCHAERYVSFRLNKHSQLVKHQQKRIRFAAASVLAICSIGYFGYGQWDTVQQQNDFRQAKLALLSDIDSARQALLDENPVGIQLSDALIDTAALKMGAGTSAPALMAIIAAVFTERRELLLQELSWFTVDYVGNKETENNGKETTFNHAKAESGSVNLENVPARNRHSIRQASASSLVVTVVGSSNSKATLREQRSSLIALVDLLKQHNSISNLVVLEAPLAKPANHERIEADALDIATSFRIRFLVDRSVHNAV